MTSPYADLDRPPLPRTIGGTGWRSVRVVAETASTNAEVAAAARAGEPDGLVLVAEHQSAGRGRLDRVWTSPPRAGLTMSFLLRPPPAAGTAGPLLPLLVATAAATALSRQTGLDVRLKWPNDLMTADRKLGGLLAEAAGGAVVVGLGLNVSNRRDELPRADATSLALEVPDQVDRLPVLRALLRGVAEAYRYWLAGGGGDAAILAAYRPLCSTVGRPVRAQLPGGRSVEGTAEGVDDAGRLLLRGADGRLERLSAGDVVHLLPG